MHKKLLIAASFFLCLGSSVAIAESRSASLDWCLEKVTPGFAENLIKYVENLKESDRGDDYNLRAVVLFLEAYSLEVELCRRLNFKQ